MVVAKDKMPHFAAFINHQGEQDMPEIEKVDKGSPIGINSPGQKRKQVYLVTIHYCDGTEKTVMIESRCVGFIRNGFLSKKRRDWLFFNSDGELVATRTAKKIGICSEIGSCTGEDGGFYIFVKPDGTPLFLNANGEDSNPPSPFFGAEHAFFFHDGITPVMEGMKQAIAEHAAKETNQ